MKPPAMSFDLDDPIVTVMPSMTAQPYLKLVCGDMSFYLTGDGSQNVDHARRFAHKLLDAANELEAMIAARSKRTARLQGPPS
jgi:hypothetical protein